jgi:Beta-xylosidase
MKKILILLSLALAVAACAPKEAPLKTCIFPGDYPDPTILRDGDDFYMTHSSFTYFPALLIWHSTDLVHWEPVARAVEDGNYSIFAPDLCKVDGKYYIYYPTSKGENYVVTADKIEGPLERPGQAGRGRHRPRSCRGGGREPLSLYQRRFRHASDARRTRRSG